MTTYPFGPKLIKGGIVLVHSTTGIVEKVIPLQYNPDTLTRTLQPQTMGENADRSEALRLKGPPVETIKLEAEIDATDQLATTPRTDDSEEPIQRDSIIQYGIFPALAVLETIIYPESAQLIANNQLASQGKLEIIPVESPLTLFVWSQNRVVPVRLTEFSITEEAFDTRLNPLRAKVSLGMRVLSVNDLGFNHRGGNLYLRYHQQKERMAGEFTGSAINALGITGIT
jgi:hypothetical protein